MSLVKNKVEDVWGVKVIFKGFEGWHEKKYTYKSLFPCEKDDVVIVPTGSFYGVGLVVNAKKNPEFSKGIEYKWVIENITELVRASAD